jgi:hypothetical protein
VDLVFSVSVITAVQETRGRIPRMQLCPSAPRESRHR